MHCHKQAQEQKISEPSLLGPHRYSHASLPICCPCPFNRSSHDSIPSSYSVPRVEWAQALPWPGSGQKLSPGASQAHHSGRRVGFEACRATKVSEGAVELPRG